MLYAALTIAEMLKCFVIMNGMKYKEAVRYFWVEIALNFCTLQDGNYNYPWFITIGTGTALLMPCLIMLHARRLQTFTGLLVMALWAAALLITITSVLIW